MDPLLSILSNCPVIEKNQSYWFFRTDGGRLYDAFKNQSVISIGYPEITVSEIIKEKTTPDTLRDHITTKISQFYPDHERPGLVASQIIKFSFAMKKKDIIIIPSYASDTISIGEIIDEEPCDIKLTVIDKQGETIDPNFNKGRKIKWIKEVKSSKFNPNLFQLFYTHQTIACANEYSTWIDSLIYDFFSKDDRYHLVLRIKQNDGINATELFRTCINLLDTTEELVNDEGINETSDSIESKINLNSPGDLELISYAPYILGLIGILVIFVNGGKFKIKIDKIGLDVEIGSDGLISRIKESLNSKTDRRLKKTLQKQIENLKIDSSEEIGNLLEKINTRNQNENK